MNSLQQSMAILAFIDFHRERAAAAAARAMPTAAASDVLGPSHPRRVDVRRSLTKGVMAMRARLRRGAPALTVATAEAATEAR